MRIRGSIRTPVDDADFLGFGMDRTDRYGGSRSVTLHGRPVRSPASQKIFALLDMPVLPPRRHGRRQRATVVNDPGHRGWLRRGHARAPRTGHGRLRFSDSPSRLGLEQRATARGPGASGKILRRNKKDLTEDQPILLNTELDHIGAYGRQIQAGRQAKERLRDLLHRAATHPHASPDRSGIAHTAAEGNNRLIKHEARNAFDFRNQENQRLRSHHETTRRSRRRAHPH